ALVPESIARDERHTEAPASDHRRQAAGGLEDAQHVAVANDRAVTKRQQHAVECCGMPAAGHEAHAREHGRIAREVLEAFRQVAEVHDAAKRGRVRPQIAADQPRVLARARERAETAAHVRQQSEDRAHRRAASYAPTKRSTLSAPANRAATRADAAAPSRARRAGSRSSATIASASAAGPPRGTSRPVSPSTLGPALRPTR